MNTWIHLCTNDDHGRPTGLLYALEILGAGAEIILSLESLFFPEPAVVCKRLDERRIQIHEKRFPFLRYATWVGNITWDAIQVDLDTAEQILNYCSTLKTEEGDQYLQAESGHTRIFDAYSLGIKVHLNRHQRHIYQTTPTTLGLDKPSTDKADYQHRSKP